MNNENLIPNSKKSPSEVREQGRNGGIKSGEVRRQKKMMKETLQELLNMPLKKGTVDEITNLAEGKGKNITAEQALCLAMIKKALKGDVSAATFVRDTSGNKVTDDVNVNVKSAGPDMSQFSKEELLKIAGIENDRCDN